MKNISAETDAIPIVMKCNEIDINLFLFANCLHYSVEIKNKNCKK